MTYKLGKMLRCDYKIVLLWGACYENKFYYSSYFLVIKILRRYLWKSSFFKMIVQTSGNLSHIEKCDLNKSASFLFSLY